MVKLPEQEYGHWHLMGHKTRLGLAQVRKGWQRAGGMIGRRWKSEKHVVHGWTRTRVYQVAAVPQNSLQWYLVSKGALIPSIVGYQCPSFVLAIQAHCVGQKGSRAPVLQRLAEETTSVTDEATHLEMIDEPSGDQDGLLRRESPPRKPVSA